MKKHFTFTSTTLIKALEALLVMLLPVLIIFTVVQTQADTLEASCVCTKTCGETERNDGCPVCAADLSACASGAPSGTASEAPPETTSETPPETTSETPPETTSETPPETTSETPSELPCDCVKTCTEAEKNDKCPVCAVDFAACAYAAPPETPTETSCDCVKTCTETEKNDKCPVCAVDFAACAYTAQPETPTETPCDCVKTCTETEKNDKCPVCAVDFAACAYAAQPETPPAVPCDCVKTCTETEKNDKCPVCAVDFAACAYAAAPCDCIKTCTEEEKNDKCPVCAVDFAACAYQPKPEEALSELLELCNTLEGWYSGTVGQPGAADKDGRLLREADRRRFLKEYDAIRALADKLAAADSTVSSQLAESEVFRRLEGLYQIMRGYMVQYYFTDIVIGPLKGRTAVLPADAESPADAEHPGFVQECRPDEQYKYPTMTEAGLAARPGYSFLGWSESADGAGTIHQPGEAFENLTETPGAAFRLYAVFADTPATKYNVTLLTSPNVKDDGGDSFGSQKASEEEDWIGELNMRGYHLMGEASTTGGIPVIKIGAALQVGHMVSEDITDETVIPADKAYIYTSAGKIKIDKQVIKGNITIEIPTALANTYTIRYDANAPEGSVTGRMDDNPRTYNDVPVPLRENAFRRDGYTCIGWARTAGTADIAYNLPSASDTGTHYNNLTVEDGIIVTLYAIWQATEGYPTALQNGSFEVPAIPGTSAPNQVSDSTNGIVWKTTASDHKIERGKATASNAMSIYSLTRASDGTQFAELNANEVGALYQLVSTTPGSKLNWGLDHKCRSLRDTEVMQVWIGSKADVERAVAQYTAAGSRVSGVDAALLSTIRQTTITGRYTDAVTWNSYSGTYTVPTAQALTMFAFVSVSDTQVSSGNLLDNVYFSATPPMEKYEVTVRTTPGGGVTVTYGGNPVTTLNAANPSYMGRLEKGKLLKLYTGASPGYSYNGALLDGKYFTKNSIAGLSWMMGDGKTPKNIEMLYSKLRTLTFSPGGGAITPPEKTLSAGESYSVPKPTRPGYVFTGWDIKCLDLKGGTPPLNPDGTPSVVAQFGDTFQYTSEAKPRLQLKRAGSVILIIPGENGVNLIANYTPQETIVNVNPNEAGKTGGGFSGDERPFSTRISIEAGRNSFVLPAPTRDGYDFDGWSYVSGTNTGTAPIATTITYSLNGSQPKLAITAVNGGAPVSIDAPPTTPAVPSTITFTAKWATRDATVPTPLAPTPSDDTIIYGTPDKILTANAAEPAGHTITSFQWYRNTTTAVPDEGMKLDGATSSTYTIPTTTPVGKYYYSCRVTVTRSNTGTSASAISPPATLTVKERPVTLTWSSDEFIYDNTLKTVTAVVSNAVPNDRVAVAAYTGNTGTLAKAYTAAATALDSPNYTLVGGTNVKHPWTIDKRAPVFFVLLDTMAFTEAAKDSHDELTFRYSYDGDDKSVVTAASDPAASANVTINQAAQTVTVKANITKGQLWVKLHAAESTNYLAADAAPLLLNIQLGQLIGGAEGYLGQYDGRYHGITVKPMFDYPSTISYGLSEADCSLNSSPTLKDVGELTVFYKIVVPPIPGVLPTLLEIKGSKVIKITKKELAVTYPGETITFGGTPALRAEVTGFVNGESAAMTGFAVPTVSNANVLPGAYQLTPDSATGTATSNYIFQTFNSGTLEILAADMAGQVSAEGRRVVYNGLPHAITVHKPNSATVLYGSSADKCDQTANPEKTAAGSYTVYYKVVQAGFAEVLGSADIVIAKAPLVVSYAGESIVYQDTPKQDFTIDMTGFVNGETKRNLDTEPHIENNNIMPGTYALFPKGGVSNNYRFDYRFGYLTITAADMPAGSVLSTDFEGVYNGLPHGITVELSQAMTDANAVVRYGPTAGSCTETAIEYTEASTYPPVFYEVTAPGYNPVTGYGRVTIQQRPVAAASATVSPAAKVYDGTTGAGTPTIILKGDAGDGTGVLAADAANVTASGTASFADKNVGNAKKVNLSAITLDGTSSHNYRLDSQTMANAATVDITEKEVKLGWKFGANADVGHDRFYDGRPSNVFAVVTDGLVGSDFCTVTTTGGSETNANVPKTGVYTAKAVGLDNPNYKLPASGPDSGLTQTYRNLPAPLTAKYLNETITYSTAPGEMKPKYKVEVTGFVNGESADTLSGFAAPAAKPVTITEAKEYTIELDEASGSPTSNYEFIYVPGTLTVTTGNILVSASNYRGDYDGKPHSLNIIVTTPGSITTYYSNPECTGAAIAEPHYTDAADEARPVYYKITVSPSYTDFIGAGHIMINRKKVTATLAPGTPPVREYDGTTEARDNVKLVLNNVVADETLGITGTAKFQDKNAGMGKTILVSGLTLTDGAEPEAGETKGKASNYELTGSVFDVSLPEVGISAKQVGLEWTGTGFCTYSGKPQNITAKVMADGVVTGDTCDVLVTGGGQVNADDTPYTATAVLSNGNYSIRGSNTADYVIHKALLTAAYAGEKISFDDVPALAVRVTGFVNFETAASAAGYTAPTLERPVIAVGTPVLTWKEGTADNYEFTYELGALEVSPADMGRDITAGGYSGAYDGNPHGITVTAPAGAQVTYYKDVRCGEDDKYAANPQFTNASKEPVIVYYKVTKPNYADELGQRAVAISPRVVTPAVETIGVNREYDGTTDTTGTLTLGNIVGGEDVTASGTFSFTDADAGTAKYVNVHDIRLSGDSTKVGNYALSTETLGTVATAAEITKKPVTLIWSSPADFTYDGTEKTMTATAAGLIAGEECAVTVADGREVVPGNYIATAKSLSSANYMLLDETTKPYVINKGVIDPDEISVHPYVSLYDYRPHEAVTVEGTEPDDVVGYRINKINGVSIAGRLPRLSSVPMVERRGTTMDITIEVERLHHEMLTEQVVAWVIEPPAITLDLPTFSVDGSGTVTVGLTGKVSSKQDLCELTFTYFKPEDESFEPVTLQSYDADEGSPPPNPATLDETLVGLAPDTVYQVNVVAADRVPLPNDGGSLYNDDKKTLRFRTPPLIPGNGIIEGTVLGAAPAGRLRTPLEGKDITVTLRKGQTVLAGKKGLKFGDPFTFEGLSDGAYNLTASMPANTSNDQYTATKTVNIKNGVADREAVIILGRKQTEVVEGDTQYGVAVDDLYDIFENSHFSPETKAKIAEALQDTGNPLEGGTVKIEMEVLQCEEGDSEIPDSADKAERVGVNLYLTPLLYITGTMIHEEVMEGEIEELDSPLEISLELPSEAQNRYNYKVYRCHGGKSSSFEQVSGRLDKAARTDGKFCIDGNLIYLYSDKFSEFKITYKTQPGGGNDSGGGNDGGGGNSGGGNSGGGNNEPARPPVNPGQEPTHKPVDNIDKEPASSSPTGTGEPDVSPTPKEVRPTLTDEDLEKRREELKRELTEKRDEAIAGLPDGLTEEQRNAIIDELNRIYEAGIAGIDHGKNEAEFAAAYNEALIGFARVISAIRVTPVVDAVLPEADAVHQEAVRQPFVLLSALLTLLAIVLTGIAFIKGRGKVHLTLAVIFTVLALLVFVMTSGINGIVLANKYTMVIAVLCTGTAISAVYVKHFENVPK